jgi:endonuclease YncB( thermonuclease family)
VHRLTEPRQGAMSSLFFMVLLLLSFNAASQTYTNALVLKISDGDTIHIAADGTRVSVRFAGIDAPETKQEYGPEATKTLQAIIADQRLTLNCFKTDRYQRKVCRVYLGEQDIALSMLLAGAAWVYRDYINELTPEERQQYLDAENDARNALKGLWNGHPVEPWVYRRQLRNRSN